MQQLSEMHNSKRELSNNLDANHHISIIVAIKNEEDYIERCIISLLNQNFPKDHYTIVVVDGMSSDNSSVIVKRYMQMFPSRIKFISNPNEWQSYGRNIAIRTEKDSDLIAYIDGHCVAHQDWLTGLYSILIQYEENGVAGVGSIIVSPHDESTFGRAVDMIFSTIIGGFGSSYMPSNKLRKVKTAPFVLYKRHVLEEVGLYDEGMRYGEDYTLNYKIRMAGYSILVNPNAVVYYYKRKTFSAFFKQMYNYGYTKAIIGTKYRSALEYYHYVPSIILLIGLLLGVLSILNVFHYTLFLIELGTYFVLVVLTSLICCWKKSSWGQLALLPQIFLVQHLAFSIGFIHGMIKKGWL